jgi:hypothetical protein
MPVKFDREGAKFLGQPSPDKRGVMTPGHDVVEKEVAVGHKDPTLRQIQPVVRREIGVVIAGQVGHATDPGGKEFHDLGATLLGVNRLRTRPGVERVAVEDEVLNVIQQRGELG